MYKLLAGLVLFAAASSANAAFVYPDAVGTDGGQFNSDFPVQNLTNAGHTDATDTEDPTVASAGLSYASANPPANGYPRTMTMDFDSPTPLSEFYLWNHSHDSNPDASDQGIGSFTLTFLDGDGNQIGTVFNGQGTPAPPRRRILPRSSICSRPGPACDRLS